MGVGNLEITIGDFTLGGIGAATFGAILVDQLLRERGTGEEGAAPSADAAAPSPGAAR